MATKRVERNLECGAEMGKREVGHRGEGIVSHDGKHECAANHVAWNKHTTLNFYTDISSQVSVTLNLTLNTVVKFKSKSLTGTQVIQG